jgi:MFS family permease
VPPPEQAAPGAAPAVAASRGAPAEDAGARCAAARDTAAPDIAGDGAVAGAAPRGTAAPRGGVRRDLSLLLGGTLVSGAGTGLTLVAAALYLRPAGAGWVAAGLVAESVPVLGVSAYAGQLVDRLPNRQLLTGALGVQGAAAVLVALLGLGPGRPWSLLAGLAVIGAGGAVVDPTVAALLPRLSGEAGATRAFGSYAAVTHASGLAGLALGGPVFAAVGLRGALLLDAASYLTIAAATALVRAQRRPPGPGPRRPAGWRWAGYRLLRHDPPMRTATLGFAAVVVLVVTLNVVSVFFLVDDIGGGPVTYGLVTACWPLAGAAGAWLAGRLRTDRQLLARQRTATGAMGLALLAAGWSAALPVVVAGWLVGGAANGSLRVCVLALVRSRSTDAERGRALAATASVLQSASLLGLLCGAALAQLASPRAIITATGAATLLVAAALSAGRIHRRT